jgi:hypothetical protein
MLAGRSAEDSAAQPNNYDTHAGWVLPPLPAGRPTFTITNYAAGSLLARGAIASRRHRPAGDTVVPLLPGRLTESVSGGADVQGRST